MEDARYLIVNADDFGFAPGVNEGIVEAYAHGIVTGASFMVRAPGAAQAAQLAREHPHLDLGLHLDLGEWVYRENGWTAVYEVVPLDDEEGIAAAAAEQLEIFRQLIGKNPTHLDSHQHVHMNGPAKHVASRLAAELAIPLRGCDAAISYCGAFFGQDGKGHLFPEGISVEALLQILRTLPAGITELGCHPGKGAQINSVYTHERAQELRVLTDPRIAQALQEEQIVLCTFDILNPLPIDVQTAGPSTTRT